MRNKKIDLEKFQTIPAFVGKSVYLRPAAPEDAEYTYRWFLTSDPMSQTCHEFKLISPSEYVERMKRKESKSYEGDFIIVKIEDKEGLEILLRYLFTEMNLNKVYAQTASFNKASVKLLESLDFKLDGTLRQHHYYKGDLYDDLIYSVLKFECGFLS
jgi:hypothetical protein